MLSEIDMYTRAQEAKENKNDFYTVCCYYLEDKSVNRRSYYLKKDDNVFSEILQIVLKDRNIGYVEIIEDLHVIWNSKYGEVVHKDQQYIDFKTLFENFAN